MAIRPDYMSGTISIVNEATTVTGTGTAWRSAPVRAGDVIFLVEGAEEFCVVVVADATEEDELQITPWKGPTVSDAEYRLRFQPDGSRYSAEAAQLIEDLASGNLSAFAALVGAPDKVPVFTGPGSMGLLNASELVNGVVYNVMVDNIAARAPYDGEPEGFAVLVANVGDGRGALYTKASNASADWSDPAYITGPTVTVEVGDVTTVPFNEEPDVVVTPVTGGVELDFSLPASPILSPGTVTTSNPGTNAEVSMSPTPTGYALNLTIPRGEGFSMKGAYAGGTAYVKGDVVEYNGSGYIAKGPTTGNAPTNPTYWDLLVVAGVDGTDGVDGDSFTFLGEYNPVTAYSSGQAVSYLGSSYIAKGATTGNVPTNPTYWDVLALKGNDGTGLVDGVGDSEGILVDNTDPTTPVVGLDIQTQTFVPTVRGETTAGAGTYSIQSGFVWKLANLVFFTATVRWSTHTGTGFINLQGIPYAPAPSYSLGFDANFLHSSISSASKLTWSGSVFRVTDPVTGGGRNMTTGGTSTLVVNGFFIAA